MTWLWWLLLGVGLILVVGGVITLRARRIDNLNRNVLKSRRSLEHALTARGQYAHDFAVCGVLDMAGAILLTDAADSCLRAGMDPIVSDGLDTMEKVNYAQENYPDRRDLESNLSRTLRLTVDETDSEGYSDYQHSIAERLDKARLDVVLTRSFHNIHVGQVRRVRGTLLARLFRLAGTAPMPETVDMDDER
ncbi:MAG: hypothetical protein ACTHYS_00805 [Ancrocorticia populi]|uniref:hypothetical protein n=2 Tax=Ancrocorticia populi TaxID=2175228 RepID=UPI003F9062F5